MKKQSLNSIMNEMARRPQEAAPVFDRRKRLRSLKELEAFVMLDEVLDTLHKEYMDAKAQRKEMVELCGGDDAMASVAIDLEDSCWCAMQTRYLELRTCRRLMAQAQELMRQRELDIEEQRLTGIEREKERRLRDFMNYLKLLAVIKEKNRTPKILEWMILLLLFKMVPLHEKPSFFKQKTFAAVA